MCVGDMRLWNVECKIQLNLERTVRLGWHSSKPWSKSRVAEPATIFLFALTQFLTVRPCGSCIKDYIRISGGQQIGKNYFFYWTWCWKFGWTGAKTWQHSAAQVTIVSNLTVKNWWTTEMQMYFKWLCVNIFPAMDSALLWTGIRNDCLIFWLLPLNVKA